MIKLSIIFSLSAMLFSSAIKANDIALESNEKTIEQKLAALNFEKRQAEVMVSRMLHSGRMNQEEASRAKREIASVKEEDVKTIRVEALETLKSTKSYANK